MKKREKMCVCMSFCTKSWVLPEALGDFVEPRTLNTNMHISFHFLSYRCKEVLCKAPSSFAELFGTSKNFVKPQGDLRRFSSFYNLRRFHRAVESLTHIHTHIFTFWFSYTYRGPLETLSVELPCALKN